MNLNGLKTIIVGIVGEVRQRFGKKHVVLFE